VNTKINDDKYNFCPDKTLDKNDNNPINFFPRTDRDGIALGCLYSNDSYNKATRYGDESLGPADRLATP